MPENGVYSIFAPLGRERRQKGRTIMMSEQQVKDMTPSQRTTLRKNCFNALKGKQRNDAETLIGWLDSLATGTSKAKNRISWKIVEKGHHEGKLAGTKRFDLTLGENHNSGTSQEWSILLDGKLVGHTRYVKDAKIRAEEAAELALATA